MIHLELPWPPSVNRYWRNVGGRVLVSKEGKAYRSRVAVSVLWQCSGPYPIFGKGARLAVIIRAFPPDKRKRDLDNLFKAVLDAMEWRRKYPIGIYPNDSQIDRLSISRSWPLEPPATRPGGSLTVMIKETSELTEPENEWPK